METQEIIKALKEDGAEDTQSMIDALCDGEYLATKKWTQEEVETCHDYLVAVYNAE